MILTAEIIERLEFIRGNVIADEKRAALQQMKELDDLLFEKEQNELLYKSNLIKVWERLYIALDGFNWPEIEILNKKIASL